MCSAVESLYCDEEILSSPWKEDVQRSEFATSSNDHDCSCDDIRWRCGLFPDDEERFSVLLERESGFVLSEKYLCRLKSSDSLRIARLNAVRWMIKASFHFSFHSGTAWTAVNCLDRFIERNLDKPLHPWMMDLLSVGCLSIAAKKDEVYVPLLQDLQIGGLHYRFNSSAIQRVELAILTTLEWRVDNVTPFSFTESMLHSLDIASNIKAFLSARVTELLLQTLKEIDFLKSTSSVLATSCMWSTLEELVPIQADSHKSKLRSLMAVDEVNVRRCYKTMEDLIVDPLMQTMRRSASPAPPPSPVAVTEVADRNDNSDVTKCITANKVVKAFIKKRVNSGQTVSLSACVNSTKRTRRQSS